MLKLGKNALDIAIVVRDVEGQRRFYGEILKLPFLGTATVPDGRVHIYQVGDALVKLSEYAEMLVRRDVKNAEAQSGLAYLTLTVTDLDVALADLESRGATIGVRPCTFESGEVLKEPVGRIRLRYAGVMDADGNMIELIEYLGTSTREAG